MSKARIEIPMSFHSLLFGNDTDFDGIRLLFDSIYIFFQFILQIIAISSRSLIIIPR